MHLSSAASARSGGGVDGRRTGLARVAADALGAYRPAEGLDDVALRVLGLRAPDRPGIVAIPIGERTDLDVAAVGLLIALSPGRLLVDVDVDVERRVMLSTSSTPLKSKPCEPADVSRLRGPEVPLRRAAGLTLGPGDSGRRGIAATLASALGAALQGVG
jgi:hypothetical protein